MDNEVVNLPMLFFVVYSKVRVWYSLDILNHEHIESTYNLDVISSPSCFKEVRFALDRGEQSLAKALILSEGCFTAFFLNSSRDVVRFLEQFQSWPELTEDDLEKMRSSSQLKNVFAGTSTCFSLSQNIISSKTRVGISSYLLLPPWLMQSNCERLHQSLAICEVKFNNKNGGDDNTSYTVRLRSGHTFKTLVILLAHAANIQSNNVRISLNDRPLFSSAVAQRKIQDIGIGDGTILTYSDAQSFRVASKENEQTEASNSHEKKVKAKKLLPKAQKKRNSSFVSSFDPQETAKERHSQLLTRLFEEAEPKFKEIRKELNDLAVQKSKRTSLPRKSSTLHKPQSHPTNVGGSAPGKVMYPIVVGNVTDLYKSSKRSSGRKQPQSSKSGPRRLSLDLHGCTTDEALRALDEALPRWIDSAMKGSYPFVAAIDIITGGGKQILSEKVERWIKSNRNVARRPKSFCQI